MPRLPTFELNGSECFRCVTVIVQNGISLMGRKIQIASVALTRDFDVPSGALVSVVTSLEMLTRPARYRSLSTRAVSENPSCSFRTARESRPLDL